MKILTIVGARPQFIKAAAFSRQIKKSEHAEILVHTGQHFDTNMSEVFFNELSIPTPKYNLGIAGGTHGEMTGRMLIEIEKVLIKEKPDLVLLYGDTNSTVAGALTAVKLHIPIAHVEAGTRMGTLSNPEEVNRIVTDHISQVLFVPTELEKQTLKKEGIEENVFIIGNIMYDSYLYALDHSKDESVILITDFDGNEVSVPDHFYYMTCHRQENTYDDRPLNEILNAMNSLDYPTIYPVHPRNQERALRLCKKHMYKNIILIRPVGYFESVRLLNRCEKVVTDSGGLQCEAFYARKMCVTILDNVCWPQTMISNRNQLSKADSEEIVKKLSAEQYIDPEYQPFGDGHSAEKIIKILGDLYK